MHNQLASGEGGASTAGLTTSSIEDAMATVIRTIRSIFSNPVPPQVGPVTAAIRTMRAAHGGL